MCGHKVICPDILIRVVFLLPSYLSTLSQLFISSIHQYTTQMPIDSDAIDSDGIFTKGTH